MEEFKNEINDKIESFEEKFNFKMESFIERLESRFENTHYELEELKDNNLQIEARISQVTNKFRTEISLLQTNLNNSFQNLEEKVDRNDGIWKTFQNTIAILIKILKIKGTLDFQDEKDKNSIALWGINQKSRNINEK